MLLYICVVSVWCIYVSSPYLLYYYSILLYIHMLHCLRFDYDHPSKCCVFENLQQQKTVMLTEY